jgi:hypothetical protein
MCIHHLELMHNETINSKRHDDAPPDSLMDSTTNLKVKTAEGKRVGVPSLARSTLGVKGRARALGRGLGRVTRKSFTPMDLHKPNNKSVSA